MIKFYYLDKQPFSQLYQPSLCSITHPSDTQTTTQTHAHTRSQVFRSIPAAFQRGVLLQLVNNVPISWSADPYQCVNSSTPQSDS